MPSYQEILSLVWSARSESEAVDLVTRIAPDIPLPNRADFVEKMIGRAQEFINGLLAGKLLLALFPILPSDKKEKLQLAASKQIERITDPGSLSRFRTLLAILTWVEPPGASLVIQVVPGSFATGRLRTIQAIIRQADPSGTRALATSLIQRGPAYTQRFRCGPFGSSRAPPPGGGSKRNCRPGGCTLDVPPGWRTA